MTARTIPLVHYQRDPLTDPLRRRRRHYCRPSQAAFPVAAVYGPSPTQVEVQAALVDAAWSVARPQAGISTPTRENSGVPPTPTDNGSRAAQGILHHDDEAVRAVGRSTTDNDEQRLWSSW
jgi:hypothetical protein